MIKQPIKVEKSNQLFERAKKVVPGGANQAHRKYEYENAVFPFIESGEGSKIYDVDGNEYIDYHCAFGPIILGRNYPSVTQAVKDAIDAKSDLFGVGGTEGEIELHEKISQHVPSGDKSLLCTSGSEAITFAIRAARGVTNKKKIIKFQGHYHGFHDSVLLNVISPQDKLGKKDCLSSGILDEVLDQTLICEWNNIEEFERIVKENQDDLAGVVLEPIPHNIGCVLPKDGFLQEVREITEKNNIILIFDEVITGWRHGIGGMQKILNVTPDITTMGKAIANGYPIAAACGKEEVMSQVQSNKDGHIFFGGTYNGHPIITAAALATIKELENPKVYEHIFNLGKKMRDGLTRITNDLDIKAHTTGFGSVFLTYFLSGEVKNYNDLLRNNGKMFIDYRKNLLDYGVHMIVKNLKRNHITYSHTEEEINYTLEASEEVLRSLTKKQ